MQQRRRRCLLRMDASSEPSPTYGQRHQHMDNACYHVLGHNRLNIDQAMLTSVRNSAGEVYTEGTHTRQPQQM